MAAQVAFKVSSISLPEGRLQMPKLARTPIGLLQRHGKKFTAGHHSFLHSTTTFFSSSITKFLFWFTTYIACVCARKRLNPNIKDFPLYLVGKNVFSLRLSCSPPPPVGAVACDGKDGGIGGGDEEDRETGKDL